MPERSNASTSTPWDLSVYDAAPTADDLGRLGESLKVSEGGEIDVDEDSGDVVTRFLPDLQRDLGLVYTPENWDKVKLVAWMCRNLPEPESTHEQKRAFVAAWIKALLDRPGFNLSQVNLLKFQIRNLIERCIRELRRETITSAYQQALFEGTPADRAAVNAATVFEFHPQAYAPVRDYDGRFYPDFLCQLANDVILAIEYKGADRWAGAEDDRLIGGLWAELSEGTCRFVMLKNREWHQIDNMI